LKYVIAVALALAAGSAAPAAAASFVVNVGPAVNSQDFGNSSAVAGAISDSYTFTVPNGSVSGFVGSIALGAGLDVTLTAVTLDGVALGQLSSGSFDLWSLNETSISAGDHVLQVLGNWGSSGGSYAGTLNFAESAVPEVASWAMMIAGFGLVGGAMRRRPTKVRYAN
jgi:hypothetical protein